MPDVLTRAGDADVATVHAAAAAPELGTVVDVEGQSGALFQIKGATWTGTVTWEATLDGTNYVGVLAVKLTDDTKALTATGDGLFFVAAPGARYVRANLTATSAGTVTVTGRAVTIANGPW